MIGMRFQIAVWRTIEQVSQSRCARRAIQSQKEQKKSGQLAIF
jgi:hypothetical protein